MSDYLRAEVTQELLERQHQDLFAIFRRIEQRRDVSPKTFLDLLIELRELLRVHFDCEERFMLSIGYEQIEGHRWHHDVFLGDLQQMIESHPTPTADRLLALRKMIVEHQEETDADYVRYYESRREY